MAEAESCVVRIVDVDESFTKDSLRELIITRCQPRGSIKSIYLQLDDVLKLFYAYIVFEHSFDAVKVTEILNGNVYVSKKFQAELIGPKLKYTKYTAHGMVKSGVGGRWENMVSIKNLGNDTEREDINELLAPYNFERYTLRNQESGLKIVYVQFPTRDLALEAIDDLQDAVCNGRTIEVSLFRT